ncbi:hypothetical protein CSPX01_03942 [Colletotrichum filicis]|nr:hypothetical protein CSPX01_03942 [Colletotrichum filicis]
MIFTADPYRVLDHVSLQLTTQSDLAGSHLSSRRGWTQPEDGAAVHPRSPPSGEGLSWSATFPRSDGPVGS